MSTCTICSKVTPAPAYTIYAANTASESWRNAQSSGTTTVYKEILPLTFAICKDCMQTQKSVKTQRKLRQALPLIGVGVAAIILGIILQTPTKSGICLPTLLVVTVTFGWGGGLLGVLKRTRSMLDKAIQGQRLSDDELVYAFHPEMRQMATQHERNFVCTESHYYRIKAHAR